MNEQNKSIPEISVDSMTLYKRLVELDEGEVVEYDALTDLIKRDVRGEAYSNLDTAKRRCESNDLIVIKPVRGVGVRRIPNDEIVAVAGDRLNKARRQTKRGLGELACADYDKLTPDQRLKHNASAAMLGTIHFMSKPSKIKSIETKLGAGNGKLSVNQTLELFSKS